MKTNISFDYSPGDTVWTILSEPCSFVIKDEVSARWAPQKVVPARVRFLSARVGAYGITRLASLDVDGQVIYDIPDSDIFMSKESAEQALADVLSRPEYNWLSNA